MSLRIKTILILTVFMVSSVRCAKPNVVIILADDLVNLLDFLALKEILFC